MKVLVLGSEGMLGSDIVKSLSEKKIDVVGADLRAKDLPVDITDKKALFSLTIEQKPDIIILSAAYTNVDECESKPDKAYSVNSEGAKNAAEAAKLSGAFLIFISTDYVFDGESPVPYLENDKPSPLSIYGNSKLKGEQYIIQALDKYLIIRTSWLYGKNGKNFVDTIIAKLKDGESLSIVNDQFGSPTFTIDLAEVIARLIAELRIKDKGLRILNITNSGTCSWYDFAKEIAKLSGCEEAIIEPVESEHMKLPAKRPKNSRLDSSRFEKLYGKSLPRWQDALGRYLENR
ncbi:MAG: dTDP-4-dehydrorhamnose reductase [Candidatus Omnitrophota bacterium]